MIDQFRGKIWERKFVPGKEITTYVKWGRLGEIMFGDARELRYGK